MRLNDYLKLGFAGVRAHKKRAIMTTIIVGIIFSLIFMAYFLFKGAEGLAFAKINQPTSGKILLSSTNDIDQCTAPDDCQSKALAFSEKVEEFGGKIIKNSFSVSTADGIFPVLPVEILSAAIQADLSQAPTGAIPILMSISTLLAWQDIELFSEADRYNKDRAAVAAKVIPKMETALTSSLGQVVSSPSGVDYYVAGFLPSNTGVAMSLESVLRKGNAWLDIILMPIAGGSSLPIILQVDNLTFPETMEIVPAQSPTSPLFSIFPNVESAYDFSRTVARSGSPLPTCLFGDLFSTISQYQSLQQIIKIVANILAVVAVIVIVTTYLRLLGQDHKIISVYFASGATKLQICLVYCVYLTILSLLAILFALCLGSLAALVINLIYQTPLEQLFALNFGTLKTPVILFGWDFAILKYIILIIILAPLSVLMGQGNFSRARLAHQLKA